MIPVCSKIRDSLKYIIPRDYAQILFSVVWVGSWHWQYLKRCSGDSNVEGLLKVLIKGMSYGHYQDDGSWCFFPCSWSTSLTNGAFVGEFWVDPETVGGGGHQIWTT